MKYNKKMMSMRDTRTGLLTRTVNVNALNGLRGDV